MFTVLAEHIVNALCNNSTIEEENRGLYQYGFFILLTRVFFFLLSILYGVILSMIWESVLFYLLLSLVRGYAGGIHASREWICTTCTSLTLLVGVLLINWFSKWDSIAVPLVILVVGAAVIGLVCPIDSAEKPLDQSEKKRYQRITWVILGGLLGASIVSLVVMFPPLLHVCATVVAVETVLAMLGKTKEKRRQNLAKTP